MLMFVELFDEVMYYHDFGAYKK